MKRYLINVGGERFSVEVLDDPRQSPVRVRVDGEVFTVTVEEEAVVEEAELRSTAPPDAAGTVTAPLPGVVKTVVVRPGQTVAAGDDLVVIEAMKMDNVIRAQRAGTVGTVYVTAGQQVAYGERLLELGDDGRD